MAYLEVAWPGTVNKDDYLDHDGRSSAEGTSRAGPEETGEETRNYSLPWFADCGKERLEWLNLSCNHELYISHAIYVKYAIIIMLQNPTERCAASLVDVVVLKIYYYYNMQNLSMLMYKYNLQPFARLIC